jgi:hypothetical protein
VHLLLMMGGGRHCKNCRRGCCKNDGIYLDLLLDILCKGNVLQKIEDSLAFRGMTVITGENRADCGGSYII